jgi:hypothetical protein
MREMGQLTDSPKLPTSFVDCLQRHRDCTEVGMCIRCARRWLSGNEGQDSRGKAWVINAERCGMLIRGVPQLSSINNSPSRP